MPQSCGSGGLGKLGSSFQEDSGVPIVRRCRKCGRPWTFLKSWLARLTVGRVSFVLRFRAMKALGLAPEARKSKQQSSSAPRWAKWRTKIKSSCCQQTALITVFFVWQQVQPSQTKAAARNEREKETFECESKILPRAKEGERERRKSASKRALGVRLTFSDLQVRRQQKGFRGCDAFCPDRPPSINFSESIKKGREPFAHKEVHTHKNRLQRGQRATSRELMEPWRWPR